jgi:hypothetical protein
MRERQVIRSPDAGSWIRPRITPPRGPWTYPICARGHRYRRGLDDYAPSRMLPPEKLSDKRAYPRDRGSLPCPYLLSLACSDYAPVGEPVEPVLGEAWARVASDVSGPQQLID